MSRRMPLFVVGFVALFSSLNCVSRDEYLRNKYSLDAANSSKSGLETELADERSQNAILKSQLETLQHEKDTLQALADNLKTENARLDAYSKDLLAKMNDILKKGIPDIRTVEVKLPPELDRALQDFAKRYPDKVEYDPKRGAVRWKSDLTFALGSDEVKADVREPLREFAGIVNSSAASGFEVEIVGHTDNVPIRSSSKRFPTNWHLSCFRSIAVMFVLHDYGVDFSRVGCAGYGEFRPRVPNPARGGEERNRRVEIFLVSSNGENRGAADAAEMSRSDGAPSASAIPTRSHREISGD